MKTFHSFVLMTVIFSFMMTSQTIIRINTQDIVHFIITDPLGRQSGCDPRGNPDEDVINGIPNSNYSFDGLGGIPDSGEAIEPEVYMLFEYAPGVENAYGTYKLQVIGKNTGVYNISSMFSIDQGSGWKIFKEEILGVIGTDSLQTYYFELDQPFNKAIIPIKDVSSSTLRQDLDNCFKLKLIGEQGFYKELSNHLNNYEKHLAKKDSLKAAREVEKFQSKVRKEYLERDDKDKRFVAPDGWEILNADAQYVIEHLVKLPAKPAGTLLQQIDGLKAEVQNQSKKKNLGGTLLTTSLTLLADQAKRELQKKDSIETAVYITLFQLLVDEIYDATVALEAIKKSAKLLYMKDEAYIALHYRAKYILEALPPLPSIDLNAQRSQKVDKQLLNEMEQMKKEQ